MKGIHAKSLALVLSLVFFIHCGGKKVVRFDPVSGKITGCSVSARVEIVRDMQGVPHILARTDEDLFFGLGYAMAQDRFTELDILRRAAEGRLGEMFGSPVKIAGFGMETVDRSIRIFQFQDLGRTAYERMDPENKALLDAFCRGMNRFLADARGTISFYNGLKLEPEPWRPEDSFAVAGLFGLTMTMDGLIEEYYLDRFFRELGPEKMKLFLPYYPESGPFITEDYSPGKARVFEPLFSALFNPGGLGSNNWAVSGSRTESGKPLLCNDPHVPTILVPTFWYHVHLKEGSYDVAGLMFPGFPAFGAALNGKIGWTLTNVGADYIDLFREKVNPENPDQYLADGEWVEFEEKTEEIRLRKKSHTATLRFTRHGVVLDPDYLGWNVNTAENEVLAMKFVDMKQDEFFRGYQMMAKAQNRDEFLAGDRLMSWGPFAWNHTYADVEGNIGYWTSGHIPIRPDNQGILPRDGWDSQNDWQGYVPFKDMPYLVNPT
jgi:penicillin amidase